MATLTLATTTSTQDSGLLDVLVPMFERQTGIGVKVIAVGSGQALELGRRGDADVLLTHAPGAEEQFMAEGHGSLRRAVMYNDFLLVGPPTDPARVQGEVSIADAFGKIARRQAPFVSRGDDSGTHRKEMAIWEIASLRPEGPWYIECGAGMAAALRMAGQKQAYTLCDRATFLTQKGSLRLIVHREGDRLLQNHYSVIVVSSARHRHVSSEAAQSFCDFLLAPAAQKVIGEFGVEEFGQPLFFVSPGQD